MSCINSFGNINETFVIEPIFIDGDNVLSACTALYTNFITSCSGDTSIQLTTGNVNINGNLIVNDAISATTYLNLPVDTFTGGTVTGATLFIGGLSANTFSATTYQNLPKDIFVTGGTYYPNTGIAIFKNNSGGTFSLSGFNIGIATQFTGGTVTGPTIFTAGLSANTISATTYLNLPNFATGDYLPLSGGTVTGATLFNHGLSANTISATTYLNLPNFVTGDFLSLSGGTVTGATVFASGLTADTISATTISADTLYGNGSNLTNIQNIYNADGVLNGNRVVNINGNTLNFSSSTYPNNLFLSGGNLGIGVVSPANKLHVSATTNPVRFEGISSATDTILLSIDASGVVHTIATTAITSGLTGVVITGYTYTPSANTFTINQSNGSAFTATFTSVSGLTINGNLNVTGNTFLSDLSANTISATTYLNLPVSNFTGGTVSGATFFSGGLSANTISATTYLNLPVTSDTRVTGATYSSNTFTFTNNTGGTFNVLFNTLSGLTVNGNLTVTGSTSLSALTASTLNVRNLSGSTDRLVQVNSGGTASATIDIISAYISSASTAATLLSTGSNWDLYGVYIGSSITGTFMGQRYYDDNYFYEAIADNSFIRLIRG